MGATLAKNTRAAQQKAYKNLPKRTISPDAQKREPTPMELIKPAPKSYSQAEVKNPKRQADPTTHPLQYVDKRDIDAIQSEVPETVGAMKELLKENREVITDVTKDRMKEIFVEPTLEEKLAYFRKVNRDAAEGRSSWSPGMVDAPLTKGSFSFDMDGRDEHGMLSRTSLEYVFEVRGVDGVVGEEKRRKASEVANSVGIDERTIRNIWKYNSHFDFSAETVVDNCKEGFNPFFERVKNAGTEK